MAQISKKFLDQVGVGYLWNKIADELAKKQDTIADGTYADHAYEEKVDKLIGDDSGKSVRKIANEELVSQLIPADAKEALDTLQEISVWIQQHPDEAASMNKQLTAVETVLAGFGTNDGQSATVKGYVDDVIAALKIGDYAKAADLASAVKRIAAIEATPAHAITDEQIAAWTAKQDAIPENTYDAYGAAQEVYNAVVALEPSDIDKAIAPKTE